MVYTESNVNESLESKVVLLKRMLEINVASETPWKSYSWTWTLITGLRYSNVHGMSHLILSASFAIIGNIKCAPRHLGGTLGRPTSPTSLARVSRIFLYFRWEGREGEKNKSGYSGQLFVDIRTNVWDSNLIGSFKMTSCIPIRILLVHTMAFYDANLPLYFTGTTGTLWDYKNIFKTTSAWMLKSPEAAPTIALPVGDCVRYQDDTFQCVPSRIVLNALSVVTVCQHGCKLHRTAMPSRLKELKEEKFAFRARDL